MSCENTDPRIKIENISRYLPASTGVHVKGSGHRAIKVGERHEHVAVARPDVQAVLAQARVHGEQHFLVAVHLIAVAEKKSGKECYVPIT